MPAVNATELAELLWHLSSPLVKVTVASASPAHLESAGYPERVTLSASQPTFNTPFMHESFATINVPGASLQSAFVYMSRWTPSTSPTTHGPRPALMSSLVVFLVTCLQPTLSSCCACNVVPVQGEAEKQINKKTVRKRSGKKKLGRVEKNNKNRTIACKKQGRFLLGIRQAGAAGGDNEVNATSFH